MDEKLNNIDEAIAEVAEEPKQEAVTEIGSQSPIKCGIILGMQEDGNVEFKVLGEHVSILDLFGLLEYGRRQVDDLYDRDTRRNLPLITRQLSELLTLLKLQLG